MTNALPRLIPTSIQRIRCFLNTQGRMNVKPWSDTEETLDAFFFVLVSNHKNDSFWGGLESLLSDLSCDLKRRMEAREGEVIDNEVLKTERHLELLDEIRAVIGGQQKGRGGFRRLAGLLSAPAFGVLMLLGSVASLGCYDSSDDMDADEPAEVDGGTDIDGTDIGDTDTLDTESNESTDKDTGEDGTDTEVDTVDTNQERTLEEIVVQAVSDEQEQKEILDCLDELHESWKTGLTELFSSEDENGISRYLRCLMDGNGQNTGWCQNPELAGEYDLDTFLDSCAVLVYLGVRFE